MTALIATICFTIQAGFLGVPSTFDLCLAADADGRQHIAAVHTEDNPYTAANERAQAWAWMPIGGPTSGVLELGTRSLVR
jgi:hypothetical protein